MSKAEPVKKCCATCKWADYIKTTTGRPMRLGRSINCGFPVGNFMDEVRRQVKAIMPSSVHGYLNRMDLATHDMWPDSPNCDGHDCPVWEPANKEKK